MPTLTYNPDVFAVPDMDAAKRIILTREKDIDTEARWARETPYLTTLLGEQLGLRSGMLVLDYGCGIGRLSKAIIEQFGCTVLGVDISQEMRGLAPSYVASPAFSVVSRGVYQTMANAGLRVDAAIAVWVLQHCSKPKSDIEVIRAGLRDNGKFTVVNNFCRAVPTVEENWVDDGQDVRSIIQDYFVCEYSGALDGSAVSDHVAAHTYWATYSKPSI